MKKKKNVYQQTKYEEEDYSLKTEAVEKLTKAIKEMIKATMMPKAWLMPLKDSCLSV